MHVVEVAPNDVGDNWVIRLNDMPKATRPTKRQAEADARLLAERRRAKLRIKRRDGSLQKVLSRYQRGWIY